MRLYNDDRAKYGICRPRRADGGWDKGMKGGKTNLYETLKREILTLQIAPDQDLDEVGLSERYGISRTPVRDVLRRLAAEGYVEVRENRGARVFPMSHATLRDFFLVAPLIYEAVGRLAVQNRRPAQLDELKACQERFRAAVEAGEAEAMVVENTRYHEIVGEMSDSAFLKPSLAKLLIDHARIGHTFFRPSTRDMRDSLSTSCAHHDRMIEAVERRDEAAMVRLVLEHWDLSRGNMEMFIAPPPLRSDTLKAMGSEPPPRRPRGRAAARAS
jgi:DNA-binding GntR family transcriptional regulator